MSGASRRGLLQGLAAAAGWVLLREVLAQSGPSPRIIPMTARRFTYEPREIPLKVGERVVVEIRSIDFMHGMNIPDLQLRLDLPPGQVTRLELAPQKAGTIEFLCDNFCGDGHEQMQGRFVVSA